MIITVEWRIKTEFSSMTGTHTIPVYFGASSCHYELLYSNHFWCAYKADNQRFRYHLQRIKFLNVHNFWLWGFGTSRVSEIWRSRDGFWGSLEFVNPWGRGYPSGSRASKSGAAGLLSLSNEILHRAKSSSHSRLWTVLRSLRRSVSPQSLEPPNDFWILSKFERCRTFCGI